MRLSPLIIGRPLGEPEATLLSRTSAFSSVTILWNDGILWATRFSFTFFHFFLGRRPFSKHVIRCRVATFAQCGADPKNLVAESLQITAKGDQVNRLQLVVQVEFGNPIPGVTLRHKHGPQDARNRVGALQQVGEATLDGHAEGTPCVVDCLLFLFIVVEWPLSDFRLLGLESLDAGPTGGRVDDIDVLLWTFPIIQGGQS